MSTRHPPSSLLLAVLLRERTPKAIQKEREDPLMTLPFASTTRRRRRAKAKERESAERDEACAAAAAVAAAPRRACVCVCAKTTEARQRPRTEAVRVLRNRLSQPYRAGALRPLGLDNLARDNQEDDQSRDDLPDRLLQQAKAAAAAVLLEPLSLSLCLLLLSLYNTYMVNGGVGGRDLWPL